MPAGELASPGALPWRKFPPTEKVIPEGSQFENTIPYSKDNVVLAFAPAAG